MTRSNFYSGAPGSEARRPSKARLGVFKFTSCDGCQLALLDCEDELLAVADAVDIVHFPEASSRLAEHGPFDLVLVEGSISTEEQRRHLHTIRSQTRSMVAIGACATSGGIQALRNFGDHEAFARAVYASPETIDALDTCTPISAHVRVDFELRGCPIDKRQLLEVITAFVVGRKPAIRDEAVCMDCKRRGTVCVMVTSDEACLGPVTHAGCDAICPAYSRGCFGCYGPRERPNTVALGDALRQRGERAGTVAHRFSLFTAAAPEFRAEAERQIEEDEQ